MRLITSLLVIFLIACSATNSAPKLTEPFLFTVVSEQYSSNSLRAVGELKGFINWNPSSVFVKIKGFASGKLIKEEKLSVTERVGVATTIEANDIVTIPVALDAPGLTDYQVELSWGEVPKTEKRSETVLLENVNFNMITSECLVAPCPSKYTVECELVNDTTRRISKVELGVGYIWQKDGENIDLNVQNKENLKLERVIVSPLNLEPGEKQALKLKLETLVNETEGGKYVPTVKILASNG